MINPTAPSAALTQPRFSDAAPALKKILNAYTDRLQAAEKTVMAPWSHANWVVVTIVGASIVLALVVIATVSLILAGIGLALTLLGLNRALRAFFKDHQRRTCNGVTLQELARSFPRKLDVMLSAGETARVLDTLPGEHASWLLERLWHRGHALMHLSDALELYGRLTPDARLGTSHPQVERSEWF